MFSNKFCCCIIRKIIIICSTVEKDEEKGKQRYILISLGSLFLTRDLVDKLLAFFFLWTVVWKKIIVFLELFFFIYVIPIQLDKPSTCTWVYGERRVEDAQKGGGVLDIVICNYTKNRHLIEIFLCHINNILKPQIYELMLHFIKSV